jgi:hypothetical protein
VLKFVGLSDIAGRIGCVYRPVVDPSSDGPPAMWSVLEAFEFKRHTPIAATIEAPPTTLANDFIRLTFISVLLLGKPEMARWPSPRGRIAMGRRTAVGSPTLSPVY